MIGMGFTSFVVLLAVAVIVTAIFHFAIRYRFLTGPDAVFAKLTVAWLGAWLGARLSWAGSLRWCWI